MNPTGVLIVKIVWFGKDIDGHVISRPCKKTCTAKRILGRLGVQTSSFVKI